MRVSIDLTVNGNSVKSHLQACDAIPIVFRNRDWTPVFNNFSFSVGYKVPNAPLKNQLVMPSTDGDNHYLGFIDRVRFEEGSLNYKCEVTNYLMKLEPYRINATTLHTILRDTADFTGASTFTANDATNQLNITAHGLTSGDRIQFDNTGGALPNPLIEGRPYVVRNVDTDHIAVKLDNFTGADIDITNTGTGTHYFALCDNEKYFGQVDSYNVNAKVQLKWLVQNIFGMAGIVLDTSLVDNIIFHAFTISSVDYTWNWSEIYIDENMLYCLNQSVALESSQLESGQYINSQITFLEFIQDLFGKLGLAIKFIGNATIKTYLLIPQNRDVDGVIHPDSEDVFVITDSNKDSYAEDTIIDDNGGYKHSRRFSDNSADYVSVTPVDIDEQDGIRVNAGKTDISWFTNLRFYLRNKAVSDFQTLNPNSYGYEFYNISSYSAIVNQIYSLLNHYHEEIECWADEIIQEKWTVKELHLNVKEDSISIIQEQNLLASG